MADFRKYAPTLMKWEGGWSDDPSDPGGATMRGVTLRTFRAFFGAERTKADLRNITEEQWGTIMKVGYWDKCKADMIRNQSVAELLADWCVNAGTPAIKGIQRLLLVEADGIIGNITLAHINQADQEKLFYKLKAARARYYTSLVEAKPKLSKFLRGWLNRTESFKFSA